MKCSVSKGRLFWTLLLLCVTATHAVAQEFKVRSFHVLETDLTARTHERLDLNGVPCAVVRVTVPESEGFIFEGNIIGEPVYSKGEALVYMTARSKKLTIKSGEYGSMIYEFSERLQKSVTYQLDLQLIYKGEYKTRTLVMPVYSYGQGDIHSLGIMLGVVRKTGGYIKGKWNLGDFSLVDSAYECDKNGKLENGQNAWYNNDVETFRFAVTAGVLHRVALPLYVYAGAGYGLKEVYWDIDGYLGDDFEKGDYVRNKDYSAKGIEVETGIIYRFAGFALSAGVQTCAFKHWEASVGFGVMF